MESMGSLDIAYGILIRIVVISNDVILNENKMYKHAMKEVKVKKIIFKDVVHAY